MAFGYLEIFFSNFRFSRYFFGKKLLHNHLTRSEICHFDPIMINFFHFDDFFLMKNSKNLKNFHVRLQLFPLSQFFRNLHFVQIPLITWFFVVFSETFHLSTNKIAYDLQKSSYTRLKFLFLNVLPNQSTGTSQRHISASTGTIRPMFE